jgi:hypothetical protein
MVPLPRRAGPNLLPEEPVRQVGGAIGSVVCRCTLPEDYLGLAFVVVPVRGSISIRSVEDLRDDRESPSNAESIASCVARGLEDASFEPFPLESDCVGCGIGNEGRFVLPVTVDRRRR